MYRTSELILAILAASLCTAIIVLCFLSTGYDIGTGIRELADAVASVF